MAWLYLLGPIGSLRSQAGIGLSTAALPRIAPSAFVLVALVMRPQSLARLLRLAPPLLLLLPAGLSLGWSADPPYGVEKLTLWTLTCLLPAAFILLLASGSSAATWRSIGAAAFVNALAVIPE